jgi:hypothetical protein
VPLPPVRAWQRGPRVAQSRQLAVREVSYHPPAGGSSAR